MLGLGLGLGFGLTRSQQRRVDELGTVGRGEHEDAVAPLDAVEHAEQLVDDAVGHTLSKVRLRRVSSSPIIWGLLARGSSLVWRTVLSCPRRGAMASNSSKKRTHGLLAAARSKRLRTWLGLGLGLGLELG